MTKADAKRIADALRKTKRLLITAHRDPDGDSVGCQLAFYEFWVKQLRRKADVVNHGQLPRKYKCLDPTGLIKSPTKMRGKGPWDGVIVFECSSLDRIGSVTRCVDEDSTIINIDHHQHNSRFGTVNVVDSEAAACGEMTYDLLKYMGAKINSCIAQQLAAAIITDTGRFHYRSTHPRTLELTAELMRKGANITALTDAIYYSYPPAHYQLMQHVLGNAQMRSGGRICFLTLREKDRKHFGIPLRELEGLVDYTLYLRGVEVGALLKEMAKNKTKVSLRSTNSVNVAEIARKFGGGGHHNASGCVIDLPLDEATHVLAKAIGPVHPRRRKTVPC